MEELIPPPDREQTRSRMRAWKRDVRAALDKVDVGPKADAGGHPVVGHEAFVEKARWLVESADATRVRDLQTLLSRSLGMLSDFAGAPVGGCLGCGHIGVIAGGSCVACGGTRLEIGGSV